MIESTGTTITLTNCYGSYSVHIPQDDITITTLLNDLVRPMLLGATYPKQLVDEFLPYQEGEFDVTYSI